MNSSNHLTYYKSLLLVFLFIGMSYSAEAVELSQDYSPLEGELSSLAPGDFKALPGNFELTGYNVSISASVEDDNGNLYICGNFGTTIQSSPYGYAVLKWDGTEWSVVGDLFDTQVYALAIDGNGVLYCGGSFKKCGDENVKRLAYWDGTAWVPLGILNKTVFEMITDPNGDIYVGGAFTKFNGLTCRRLAKIVNNELIQIGSNGINGTVNAIVSDNSGNIYAGGSFTKATPTLSTNVVKWNVSLNDWESIGADFSGTVNSLEIDNQGVLFASGYFTNIGTSEVGNIAKRELDGTWVGLDGGANAAISDIYSPRNGKIIAAGYFDSIGGKSTYGLGYWNGNSWKKTPTGEYSELNHITQLSNGDFLVGGKVLQLSETQGTHLATYDGNEFTLLEEPGLALGDVNCLEVSPDGVLYAGGFFQNISGLPLTSIAKWNGNNWMHVGNYEGLGIEAMAWDSQGDLYVAARYVIKKWDGSIWTDIGEEFSFRVEDITFDSNDNMYAVGNFGSVGGMTVNGVAKWDGVSWSALSSGVQYNGTSSAYCYAVACDAQDNVYVGGDFNTAGGVSASSMAKWNGTSWSALGSGISGSVRTMDFGVNGDLYVGGFFTQAGGAPANYIARWDGNTWNSLGTGLSFGSYAIATSPDGKVYAGSTSGNNFAIWDGLSWTADNRGLSSGWSYGIAVANPNEIYFGGNSTPKVVQYTPPLAPSIGFNGQGTSETNEELKSLGNGEEFLTFPNPFSENLQIMLPEEVEKGSIIQVTDARGRLVYSDVYSGSMTRLDIPTGSWKAGLYSVKVGKVTRTVVKE